MTQQQINYGTTPGDNTGDTLYDSFKNCDDNFNELYGKGPTIDLDKHGVAIGNLPLTNQNAIANVIAKVKSAEITGAHLKINAQGTVPVCKGDSGDYLTRYSSILLPSNCWFELGPNTTLQMQQTDGSQDEQAYLFRNDDPVSGNSNIRISGGQLDGNWVSGQPSSSIDVILPNQQGWYGTILWVEGISGFYLHDVEFVNPGRWVFASHQLYRGVFERLFFNDVWRDGLHFCGDHSDIVVRDILRAKTGDNTIAITTRENQSQGQAGGYFEGEYNDVAGNIVVGNIDRVLLDNIDFDGANGPIAIFGNSTEHIHNVTIRHLTGTTDSGSPYCIATKNYPLVGSNPEIKRLTIEDVSVATRATGQSDDDAAVFLEQEHGTEDVIIKNVKAINGSAINFNGDSFTTIILDDIYCDRSTLLPLIRGNNRFTFAAESIQAGTIACKYASGSEFGIDLSNLSSTWGNFAIDDFHYENDSGNGRALNINYTQRINIGAFKHKVAPYTAGDLSVVVQNGQANVGVLVFDNAQRLTGGNCNLNVERILLDQSAATPVGQIANVTKVIANPQIETFTVLASDVNTEAATTAISKTIKFPRCTVITMIAIRAKTAFAGTGITDCTVDVRRATPGSVLGVPENVFSVPTLQTATTVQDLDNEQGYQNGLLELQLRVNTTGANCDQLTAGQAEVFIGYMMLGSGA